ncbi:MAG: HAD family hydrolase [archaeon]
MVYSSSIELVVGRNRYFVGGTIFDIFGTNATIDDEKLRPKLRAIYQSELSDPSRDDFSALVNDFINGNSLNVYGLIRMMFLSTDRSKYLTEWHPLRRYINDILLTGDFTNGEQAIKCVQKSLDGLIEGMQASQPLESLMYISPYGKEHGKVPRTDREIFYQYIQECAYLGKTPLTIDYLISEGWIIAKKKHSVEIDLTKTEEYCYDNLSESFRLTKKGKINLRKNLRKLQEQRNIKNNSERAKAGLNSIREPVFDERYNRLIDTVCSESVDCLSLYPDAIALMKELAQYGIPVAIVSDTSSLYRQLHQKYITMLESEGIHPGSIVLSCDTGRKKTAQEGKNFLVACEGIGVEPENIATIGDQFWEDGIMPKMAGIKICLVLMRDYNQGVSTKFAQLVNKYGEQGLRKKQVLTDLEYNVAFTGMYPSLRLVNTAWDVDRRIPDLPLHLYRGQEIPNQIQVGTTLSEQEVMSIMYHLGGQIDAARAETLSQKLEWQLEPTLETARMRFEQISSAYCQLNLNNLIGTASCLMTEDRLSRKGIPIHKIQQMLCYLARGATGKPSLLGIDRTPQLVLAYLECLAGTPFGTLSKQDGSFHIKFKPFTLPDGSVLSAEMVESLHKGLVEEAFYCIKELLTTDSRASESFRYEGFLLGALSRYHTWNTKDDVIMHQKQMDIPISALYFSETMGTQELVNLYTQLIVEAAHHNSIYNPIKDKEDPFGGKGPCLHTLAQDSAQVIRAMFANQECYEPSKVDRCVGDGINLVIAHGEVSPSVLGKLNGRTDVLVHIPDQMPNLFPESNIYDCRIPEIWASSVPRVLTDTGIELRYNEYKAALPTFVCGKAIYSHDDSIILLTPGYFLPGERTDGSRRTVRYNFSELSSNIKTALEHRYASSGVLSLGINSVCTVGLLEHDTHRLEEVRWLMDLSGQLREGGILSMEYGAHKILFEKIERGYIVKESI